MYVEIFRAFYVICWYLFPNNIAKLRTSTDIWTFVFTYIYAYDFCFLLSTLTKVIFLNIYLQSLDETHFIIPNRGIQEDRLQLVLGLWREHELLALLSTATLALPHGAAENRSQVVIIRAEHMQQDLKYGGLP